jgi:hypothetical protein
VIDWLHLIMAVLFFVSALLKLRRHYVEHFFTRIVNSAWHVMTVLYRDMPVENVRIFSTGLIIVMLFVEIASPFFRWNLKRLL